MACDDGPNGHPGGRKGAGENCIEAMGRTGGILAIHVQVDLRRDGLLQEVAIPCSQDVAGFRAGGMSDQLLALYLMSFEVRT